MPKLTVENRNGKLVIISQTESQGGPTDSYIAVRPDKQFISVKDSETAKEFVKEGGTVYFLTHYMHNGDWLPKVYNAERYAL